MKHTIIEQISDGAIKAFYLKERADSRINSTLVIFSPEGIAITGDYSPLSRGVCSAYGYGVGWFASELSGSYLCEKFLQKEWSQKQSFDYLKERYEEIAEEIAEEYDEEENKVRDEHLESIVLEIEKIDIDDITSYNVFLEIYEDIFNEYPDDCYFMDYDENERYFLIEIQNNFRELYNEKYPQIRKEI